MFGSRSPFDKALEKATSQLLLEPDWDSILQISDCIRQGDVQAKYALSQIKRKIGVENPHVSLFALQVLESCVKNCGSVIHAEVATKEFMEFLKHLVTIRADPVKAKVLELVQVWSHAFRNEASYKVVQDTYNLMKLEGYNFPALKESDAMFMAESAPEWKDGDCCTRCRVAFGMVQRKHHCRNCGEVFCGKCSSKSSILPKFGIEREVRVCDACFDNLNESSKKGDDDLPAEYLASPLSKQAQTPPKKSEEEIQEEEELQLALAISQSEEEAKAKERERRRNNYSLHGSREPSTTSSPMKTATYTQPAAVSAPMVDTADMDPELARYLNRNYWQQRSDSSKQMPTTTQPSAPVAQTEAKVSEAGGKVIQEVYQNGETPDEDPDQFFNALQSSVEIFVNRMRSNSQRGRSIATDSSVQSLFNVISNMHPQLMKYIQDQEETRGNFEALQDKLAQLKDAREALDALREDHREKRRREMEELERQRQIQMAQKLEIMRQKKHEYLEMQRQMALQRLQEQEREMQMRLEQQKQMTHIRQMQNYGYPQQPQAYPPGQMQPGMPQGYNPAGAMEGSPVHQIQQQGGYMGNMPPMGPGMGPGAGGPQQMVTSQQMYASSMPQGTYSQAGGSVPGQFSQSLPPQGGYPQQPDTQQVPPGGYSMVDGSMPAQPGGTYQPTASMGYNPAAGGGPAQTLPSHVTQTPQGYSSLPQNPSQEYQPYNMQAMSSALPTDTQGYSQPQQQYMGGTQIPPGQYQQGGPPPPQQQQPQGMVQQQPPPPQPVSGPSEAQLISFD